MGGVIAGGWSTTKEDAVMPKTLPFIPAMGQSVVVLNSHSPHGSFTGTLIGWGTIGCTVVPDKIRDWMHDILNITEENGEPLLFIQCDWENLIPY
jgi:hypothetical protein